MERPHVMSLAASAGSLGALFGFGSHRMAHQPGQGAARAAVRERAHREQQAERVAPALQAFAEQRAETARRRVARWQRAGSRDLSAAPGHIKRMSREQKVRR